MTYAERSAAVMEIRNRPTEKQLNYIKSLVRENNVFTDLERIRIRKWLSEQKPTKAQVSKAIQKILGRVNARNLGIAKMKLEMGGPTTWERHIAEKNKKEPEFWVDVNIALEPGAREMKKLKVLERFDNRMMVNGKDTLIKRYRVFACWEGTKDTIYMATQICGHLRTRFNSIEEIAFPLCHYKRVSRTETAEKFRFDTLYPDETTGFVHIEIVTRPLTDREWEIASDPRKSLEFM